MKIKESYGWIYLFTVSGKGYIGQTVSLKIRFKHHFRDKKHNPYFHNSLRKHFKENGSFKILECWKRNGRTLEEFRKLLGSREIFWIKKINTNWPTGWNFTKGGTGGDVITNNPNRERIRQKMSNSGKGKIISEETREKLSEANKGQIPWSKGKSFSQEHRKKISNSNKGKIVSEETRKKLSESHKGLALGEKNPNWGKHRSEEIKRKVSEAQKERLKNKQNHPNFGKKLSEETKKKISESRRKR